MSLPDKLHNQDEEAPSSPQQARFQWRDNEDGAPAAPASSSVVHAHLPSGSTIVFDSFSAEHEVERRNLAAINVSKIKDPSRRFAADFTVRISGRLTAVLSASTVADYRVVDLRPTAEGGEGGVRRRRRSRSARTGGGGGGGEGGHRIKVTPAPAAEHAPPPPSSAPPFRCCTSSSSSCSSASASPGASDPAAVAVSGSPPNQPPHSPPPPPPPPPPSSRPRPTNATKPARRRAQGVADDARRAPLFSEVISMTSPSSYPSAAQLQLAEDLALASSLVEAATATAAAAAPSSPPPRSYSSSTSLHSMAALASVARERLASIAAGADPLPPPPSPSSPSFAPPSASSSLAGLTIAAPAPPAAAGRSQPPRGVDVRAEGERYGGTAACAADGRRGAASAKPSSGPIMPSSSSAFFIAVRRPPDVQQALEEVAARKGGQYGDELGREAGEGGGNKRKQLLCGLSDRHRLRSGRADDDDDRIDGEPSSFSPYRPVRRRSGGADSNADGEWEEGAGTEGPEAAPPAPPGGDGFPFADAGADAPPPPFADDPRFAGFGFELAQGV